jgi:multiple antibiotic resistance protein
LLLTSSAMAHAQCATGREQARRRRATASASADAGDSIAVVPLTIPLLTGPATISTMVIYAEKTRTFFEHAVLVGYGVVIGAATYVAFVASGRIARVLGQTGINVMTRLMGLILAAMAVELLADGLGKLFPILGLVGRFRKSAAALALRCMPAKSFSRHSDMPPRSVGMTWSRLRK